MTEQYRGINVGGEFYVNRGMISPDTLGGDNRSTEADLRLQQWEFNRAEKNLTLLNTCSDARIITPHPTSSVVVRSIAAGRDLEPFSKLIMHKSIDNVHLMGHHSGNSTVEGDHPRGCGGLGVKEAQLKGQDPSGKVELWVSQHVHDSDCLLNAFATSEDVLQYTDKDILLSTQDHLDHTIIPMSGFINGAIVGPIHLKDFSKYDTHKAYKGGIPTVTSAELKGSSFEEYLREYFETQLPNLLLHFSEHDRTTQEQQNPKMLLITTNIRPPEVGYPGLTRNPNTVFVETLAREKVKDEIQITDEDIASVLDQAEYPISHFQNMTTVFIETGDMDQSVKIARAFEERRGFLSWIERKTTQILIGETKAGRVNDIKKF